MAWDIIGIFTGTKNAQEEERKKNQDSQRYSLDYLNTSGSIATELGKTTAEAQTQQIKYIAIAAIFMFIFIGKE